MYETSLLHYQAGSLVGVKAIVLGVVLWVEPLVFDPIGTPKCKFMQPSRWVDLVVTH